MTFLYGFINVKGKVQADRDVQLVQCNTVTNNITTISIAVPTEVID